MNIARQFKRLLAKKAKRRSFDAGMMGRLLGDWTTQSKSADAELRGTLVKIRARSRELANNNDYAKKYLSTVAVNVVGPNGVGLQSKAKDSTGKFDKPDNDKIEAAWAKWGKVAETGGRMSWVDFQNSAITAVAKDGEVLIRLHRGFDNPFLLGIQILEADHLDDQLNKTLENGNRVRMGIELDKFGRPVNYWVLKQHPGETGLSGQKHSTDYEIIPASEIIHAYRQDRPGQTRGVPWMVTAMTRLHQLGEYEEAELVAARVGACKMGFFTTPEGGSFTGQSVDGDGAQVVEASPGTFTQLERGQEFKEFDPTHPAGNFGPFIKTALRGISSGLNISYNSLASDLEGVNFSSIRSGVLEERESWKCLQEWFIAHVCQPIYDEWLAMALLSGQLAPIPSSRLEKFASPRWKPRRWSWVDPLKDVQAKKLAVRNGFTSRKRVIEEVGDDPEEIYAEILAERKEAEDNGLVFESNQSDDPGQDLNTDSEGGPDGQN